MEAEKLAQMQQRLHDMMEGQVASETMVGGALRVIHGGEILFDAVFGEADREQHLPMKADSIYRMYSMTKPVTAVALMILYDRGQIDLHDHVCWFLPGFRNQKVATEDGLVDADRELTILDLLSMTSGLVYPDRGISPAGDAMADLFDEYYREAGAGRQWSTVEMCNRIGQVPLCAQPGAVWNYGTSADVLAGVIEVVSGLRYSDFLKKEIFEPLGMKDTDFYVPEDRYGRLAQVYIRNSEGKLEVLPWQHLGLFDFYRTRPNFEIGGAGLVSTMEDYSAFAECLLGDGTYHGRQIISAHALSLLRTNHLRPDQKKTYNWEALEGYGYGGLMRVLEDPVRAGINAVGEYGWDGWTGNYFFVDPGHDLAMVYLIQTAGGNGPRPIRALKQIIYSYI